MGTDEQKGKDAPDQEAPDVKAPTGPPEKTALSASGDAVPASAVSTAPVADDSDVQVLQDTVQPERHSETQPDSDDKELCVDICDGEPLSDQSRGTIAPQPVEEPLVSPAEGAVGLADETGALAEPESELRAQLDQFRQELSREKDEFRKFRAYWDDCARLTTSFQYVVQSIDQNAVEVVNLRDITGNTDLPGSVLDTVKNSKTGVDLVLKMISKLSGRMPRIDDSGAPSEEGFTEPGLESIPTDSGAMKSYLDRLSTQNYTLLTDMRRRAEDARARLFSFMKTHVLAIIDGLVDGRRHFEQQKTELLRAHPACREEIDNWFSVYDALLELFQEVLQRFELQAIEPEVGEKTNYELHEPFDVVSADGVADETIYELIRPGYKYAGSLYGGPEHVIRPALVVIAKNKQG
jgi:molecular chaperone GrpE (heat shock protein)